MKKTEKTTPPGWAVRLLKWMINPEYFEEISGDMLETFRDNQEKYSTRKAGFIYVLEVFRLFRPNLLRAAVFNFQRFNNIHLVMNFKIAYRNMKKFRTHTAINLLGLSMGLAIGGFILVYVLNELSFDNFHQNRNRVFKVITENEKGPAMETNAWPVGHYLKAEYPEVENVVYTKNVPSIFKVTYKGEEFDHKTFFASSDFFNVFSFSMVEGNPDLALSEPFSLVITETISRLYFDGNALGSTLIMADSVPFKITGIVQDVPDNSHIQFDILMSFSTFEQLNGSFSYTDGWGMFNMRNYVMLKEGATIQPFSEKARNMYMEKAGEMMESFNVEFYLGFVPLKEVYLTAGVGNGFGPKGSMERVQIMLLIGSFVLLLAIINYVNLASARSVYRAREVGIRKVSGSTRWALVRQFMTESFVVTFLSFIIGMIIIVGFLPFFNTLTDKNYTIMTLMHPGFIYGAALLLFLTGVLAGTYPSLLLSGHRIVESLKGNTGYRPGRFDLRKGLIAFQFFIAVALILSTLLMADQLNFMKNQDLGFDKEQILVVDALNIERQASIDLLKNDLSKMPAVVGGSFSNALPGRPGWHGQWAYPEKISDDKPVDTEYMAIDEFYVPVLGLDLLAGRNFNPDIPSELENGLIINETCSKQMGWINPEEAIGKEIVSPSEHPAGTVIGVVKDYHGLGLQQHIWPKAMDYSSSSYGRYLAIRFEVGDMNQLLTDVGKSWKSRFPDQPFDYFFLNEDFDKQYREEEKLADVLLLLTVIIIVISGIGLFGMVSFVTLSRTKEVGIRKTFGASVGDIVFLFNREYILLVLLSNILAVPVVWYYGEEWLNSFAYHTHLKPVLFVVTFVLTLLIAFMTVSFQTLKTALQDPVRVLRYE